MMIRKWLTKSNLLNGLFFLVLVVFMINPTAKVFLIRGLMKAGLFQPDLSGRTVSTNNIALPNLVFEDSNGTTINLAELKGKVVFINFWATWCPPCIAEMPSINELHQKLKNNKDIIFITVDVDHNFQKSKAFMVKHRLALPLYQAVNPIPSDLLGNAIPTTVIFDKAGQIVYHHEGQADYSNLRVAEYLVKIAK